jgi:hypothetical protein
MIVGFIYVLIKNIIDELFQLSRSSVLLELSNTLPCLITPNNKSKIT